MKIIGGDFLRSRATFHFSGATFSEIILHGALTDRSFGPTAIQTVQIVDRRTDVSYFGAIGGADLGGLFGGETGAVAGAIKGGLNEVMVVVIVVRGGGRIIAEVSHPEYVALATAPASFIEKPEGDKELEEYFDSIQPEAPPPAQDGHALDFLEQQYDPPERPAR